MLSNVDLSQFIPAQRRPDGGGVATDAAPPAGTSNRLPDLSAFISPGAVAPEGGRATDFGQDFTQFSAPPPSLADELVSGTSAGVDQLQASLFGLTRLVGRELGLDTLEDIGNEGIDRNQAEAQRTPVSIAGFDQIESFDDFTRWAAGTLGNALPSLALAAGSGGFGGVLAKKAVETSIRQTIMGRMKKNLLSKGLADDVADAAIQRAITSPAGISMLKKGMTRGVSNATMLERGFTRGASIGVVASAGAPIAGDTDIDLVEHGVESGFTSIVAGLAGGALEILPVTRLINRAFPGIQTQVAKNFIKDFAVSSGTQALIEGSTEAAQELVQLAALAFHDPSFDMLSATNRTQILNAFAAGALVGTITGGAADVIGGGTRAARRLGEIGAPAALPRFSLDLDKGPTPDSIKDFIPADNTFFDEVKNRVNSVVTSTIEPVMNTIRDQYQSGVDSVAGSVPALNRIMSKLTGDGRAAQEEFIAGHKPILDDTARWAKEQIVFITDEAQHLFGDERKAFVEAKLAEVKQQVDSVAATLRERADKIMGSLTTRTAGLGVLDEFNELGRIETDTEFVFGKNGTERDAVEGFQRRSGARKLLKELRVRFPSARPDAFGIRQQEDGTFIVALEDSGQAAELRDDESLTKAITASRISARRNPKRAEREQVKVQMKGVAGQTFLDIRTLVFEGRKLGENTNQTAEQVFASVTGRMLDQGIIGDDGFLAMQEAFNRLFPGKLAKETLTKTLARDNRIKQLQERLKDIPEATLKTEAGQRAITKDREELFKLQQEEGGTRGRDEFSTAVSREDFTEEVKIEGEPTLEDAEAQLDKEAFEARNKRGRAGTKLTLAMQKNIDRIKKIIASMPEASERNAGERAEFAELRAQLRILETNPIPARKKAAVVEDSEKKAHQTKAVNRTARKERARVKAKAEREQAAKEKHEKKVAAAKRAAKKAEKAAAARLKQIADELNALDADALGTASESKKSKTSTRLDEVNEEIRNLRPSTRGDGRFEALHAERKTLLEAQLKRQAASAKAAKTRFDKKFPGLDKKVAHYLPKMNPKIIKALDVLLPKLANLLSDKVTVRVINARAAAEMIAVGHPDADIAAMLAPGRFEIVWHAQKKSGRVMYIMVDDFKNPGRSLSGMLHEFGHAIHFDTWADLTVENQNKLWDAFVADVKSGGRGTGADINLDGINRPTPAATIDVFEFREWMADKFVDWMNNRTQPATALEKFLESVGKKIEQLYEFMLANGRRFTLISVDQTYGQFMDAVAKRIAHSDPSATNPFFINENAGGRNLWSLSADINAPLAGTGAVVPRGLSRPQWNDIQKRLTEQYPVIAARTKLITDWIHNAYNLALAPSTSVMRSLAERVPEAAKLVSIFSREEHGKAKRSSNYHQRLKLMKGRFIEARYTAITKNMTEAEKTSLLKELQKEGEPVSHKAKEIRKLFDEVHAYMKDAGLPVGRIPNYFPRTYSREKLIADEAEIIKQLAARFKRERPARTATDTRQMAQKFFNSMISREADEAAALRQLQADELAMQSPSFRNMNSRTANEPFLSKYLEDNLDGIVTNYLNAAIKKSEFNRFLGATAPPGVIGGPALRKNVWNSRGKIEAILENAESQGATKQDLKAMKNYVDANLGMFGRDSISERTRTILAGIIAYTNMRMLLFTVFASLPDSVGPAIRSGNMRNTFKTAMKNIHEIRLSDSELSERARAWGIISSAANQHMMTEYVDNHFMPPTLRKWNDAFFKWTGLNYYTDFTRKYALAVGIDTIKYEAVKVNDQSLTQRQRDRAKQFLAELGLTSDMVDVWVDNGERTWGGIGYDTESAVDVQIAEALIQFVDESIMSPNPSQRPLLASHPAVVLVYHLKGFIYAIHDVVLKRLVHNYNIANTPAQVAAAIAPAILMVMLTAFGLELRELITGSGKLRRMDGWEYTWESLERSGLLGIPQLGWDFNSAGARGQSEFVALGGPAIGQLADLISKPISQTIPKAIPIVSQLPWARDALRETTPL